MPTAPNWFHKTAPSLASVAAHKRALLSEIENFLGMRVKAVLPPTAADAVAQRTDAFKQRLGDVIDHSNLEIYMTILNDLTSEGYDWSEVAAAAVKMIQHTARADTLFTRKTERRSSPPRPVHHRPAAIRGHAIRDGSVTGVGMRSAKSSLVMCG